MTVPDASAGTDAGQSSDTIPIVPGQDSKVNRFYRDRLIRNVPQEILRNGLFCDWRYEERGGQKTKVPYHPVSGRNVRSNDPSTFCSFEEAVSDPDRAGIGIGIFHGICAIDLDDCLTDSGYYTETAAEVVALMHSYTEISPSGKGVHILFQADGFRYDIARYYVMNHRAGIEVYVAGATSKYVTLTGAKKEDYPYGERAEELKMLLEKFMRREDYNTVNPVPPDAARHEEPEIRDEDLIAMAKASRNGAAFTSLWSGSTAGYESSSEADLALCSMLAFWTGRDAQRMDRLFRKSGLIRDKWDRKQSGTTYGAITIRKAIDGCQEVYQPRKKSQEKKEFPPIVPLTAQRDLLPDFPVDALPDVVQRYVLDVAEQSQTSADMAAVIALGVLAACLQKKYKVKLASGYCEPLSLYIVVIAKPGERKSSVLRSMTTVLSDYEKEYNEAHSEERSRNRRERENLERQIAGLKKRLEKTEDREMELQLQSLETDLEEMPVLRETRFIADDCTSEALIHLLKENNGVISVISAEGGIFDIMAGRYSNRTNLDVWLKSHDGDSIYIDRIGREAECVQNPALTAILTIQPSVLDEIMENPTLDGRGLLPRFLYSFPASRIGSRTFESSAIPESDFREYRDLIFHLMGIPAGEEKVLYLSPDAEKIMAEYFDEHEQYMAGEGQAIAEWASKYIGSVLRIAGLLHGAEMDPEDNVIDGSTVSRAIRIGKYFLAHACYAYSLMGTDETVKKARFILEKMKSKGQPKMKRSDVYQLCRGKFFKNTEEIYPVLDLLEDHGYLMQVTPEHHGKGRPADVEIILNQAA